MTEPSLTAESAVPSARTPVLIADDATAQRAARRRGWAVLLRHDRTVRLLGDDPSLTLPPLPFSIDDGSLTAEHAPGWDRFLNWLAERVDHPMLIVAPDEWAGELALWAAASRGWPFGVWVYGPAPLHTPLNTACLLSAEGLFAPDPVALGALRSRWKEPLPELPDEPRLTVAGRAEPAVAHRAEGLTRILVASHHGSPPQLAARGVAVDFVTALRRPGAGEREHVVANLGPAGLATGRGPLPATVVDTLAADLQQPVAAADHIGGYWHWRVQNYFDRRDDHFDVVWLRGEPYVTAPLIGYAQHRWGARVILEPHSWARYDTREERAQVEADTHAWAQQADAVLMGAESPEQILALIRALTSR